MRANAEIISNLMDKWKREDAMWVEIYADRKDVVFAISQRDIPWRTEACTLCREDISNSEQLLIKLANAIESAQEYRKNEAEEERTKKRNELEALRKRVVELESELAQFEETP